MIVATSRFRVANGKEAEVRAAFAARPRRVEEAPGFLGLRLLADVKDPSVFVIETLWSDAESFRAWHRSPAHSAAHAGIPAGLKLDPASTELRVFEQVPASPEAADELASWRAAAVLAPQLAGAAGICVVEADREGVISWCNQAFADAVQVPRAEATGRSLTAWLTAPDAERLRALLRGDVPAQASTLLNLVAEDQLPSTLSCHLVVDGRGLLLVGQPVLRDERKLHHHLLQLGNELTAALRENERARRELAAAKDELERGHWHLRKIEEVLPFCMSCHKVKVGETAWEDVVSFLQKNSGFLSHGYCPSCGSRLEEEAP